MDTIFLQEVDSTNLYGKSNLQNLTDKTVILADVQLSGRGRFERKWVNLGKGNLFMSIILKPSNSFNEIYSNLTQYLSVVLSKVLEEYGVAPQIKWPNDVLIDGKKIAGILCETVMQGINFKGLVLGVGVNLNATLDGISSVDKKATALNIEFNRPIERDEFFEKLTTKFFENYENFLEKGFELIKNDYISHACFLDSEVCVQVFNEKKCGKVKSVNDKGELVLENNNKEFVLTIGDIL